MCSTPKVPKVQDIPMRATAILPDGGDPGVRGGLRAQRQLSTSMMMLANRGGVLGAPTTSTPLGTGGL